MTAPTAVPFIDAFFSGWTCPACKARWTGARAGHGGTACPGHSHDDTSRLDLTEVRMSDCEFGCKIWRCSCGEEMLLHSATYGCRGGAA